MARCIAIQEIKGSFYHKVAQSYFKDNVAVQECDSFSLVKRNDALPQTINAVVLLLFLM